MGGNLIHGEKYEFDSHLIQIQFNLIFNSIFNSIFQFSIQFDSHLIQIPMVGIWYMVKNTYCIFLSVVKIIPGVCILYIFLQTL